MSCPWCLHKCLQTSMTGHPGRVSLMSLQRRPDRWKASIQSMQICGKGCLEWINFAHPSVRRGKPVAGCDEGWRTEIASMVYHADYFSLEDWNGRKWSGSVSNASAPLLWSQFLTEVLGYNPAFCYPPRFKKKKKSFLLHSHSAHKKGPYLWGL